MKRLFASALLSLAFSPVVRADESLWRVDDYEGSLAEAKKSGKLLQVDWSAEWCGWCKKMEADTFSDAGVQEMMASTFVNVRMDKDKFEELARKMGIEGIPAFLYVDGEGRIIGRLVGYRPVKEYTEAIKGVTDSYARLQDAEKKIAADPKDTASREVAANVFVEAENWEEADKHLAAAIAGTKTPGANLLWTVVRSKAARNDADGTRDSIAKLLAADPRNEKGFNDDAALIQAKLLIPQDAKSDSTPAREAFDKISVDYPGTNGSEESMFMVGVLIANFDKDFDAAIVQFKKLEAAAPQSEWGKRATNAVQQCENLKKQNKK